VAREILQGREEAMKTISVEEKEEQKPGGHTAKTLYGKFETNKF
jgi:hypothetical protein